MRPGNTEIEPELDAPQYNQRLLYTGRAPNLSIRVAGAHMHTLITRPRLYLHSRRALSSSSFILALKPSPAILYVLLGD